MEYLHAKAEKAGVAPQLKKVDFFTRYGVHKEFFLTPSEHADGEPPRDPWSI